MRGVEESKVSMPDTLPHLPMTVMMMSMSQVFLAALAADLEGVTGEPHRPQTMMMAFWLLVRIRMQQENRQESKNRDRRKMVGMTEECGRCCNRMYTFPGGGTHGEDNGPQIENREE